MHLTAVSIVIVVLCLVIGAAMGVAWVGAATGCALAAALPIFLGDD